MNGPRIISTADLDGEQLGALFDRRQTEDTAAVESCRGIIAGVRQRGDVALRHYTRSFDGVDLQGALRVDEAEFERAQAQLDPRLGLAIDTTIENVRRYHRVQLPEPETWVEVQPGVRCGHRWTAVDSACLYVPRGRGSFASVACMLGVPATLAGVGRIIVCTPPGPGGTVDQATLVACRRLGIDAVYRVGGAQAVAAVAYGTASLPACAKFIGPGNVYVSTARRLLRDVLDTGLIAGPSESLIVCGRGADPANAAWNLLVEAEHGENSTAWLVTDCTQVARAVADAVEGAWMQLSAQRQAYAKTVLTARGGILVARDMDEVVALANRIAAEHVAVMGCGPEVVAEIRNAGEIIFGDGAVISLANYVMGLNAILPTGGWARTAGAVGVTDFMKRVQLGQVTAGGLQRLRDHVSTWSRDEGFSAHHLAAEAWRVPTDTCEVLS